MVKKLDESIGDIIEALSEKEILQNSIIVFVSDNGGMTSGNSMNYASNWPLRGIKMSPFEGGVRVVGLLWTPNLRSNHVWQGYMHVVDWMPTLLRAAGSEAPLNIDGIDMWNQILSNGVSFRHEFYEIDDYTGFASITSGDFKFVTGTIVANYSTYQGGDLMGIIGKSPSYEESIKNSKMFTILNGIGKPFDFEDINVKNEIKINCKKDRNNLDNICYPDQSK